LRLSLIDPSGRYLGRLPVHDLAVCRGMIGPMCVRACRCTAAAKESGREDVLVVLHTSGRALLFSPSSDGDPPPESTDGE
jgi:hypothetical protein